LTEANFDALDRYEAFARDRRHSISDLAIAWLLANPLVCSVITGITSPEQLEGNAASAEWKLAPDELARLHAPA
jgi:aryl-alcohol dehydrogenase-like predicted oxidoreductase